jgi:hypothetical protein
MLESFLIAAGGIGAMLAMGLYAKWSRGAGRVAASLREHPAWEAVADELVRALRPLKTEVRGYRDENDDTGMVILVRGVDPGFTLRSTGRTTGDVEVGHLGFDQQFRVQGPPSMVRARLDGPTRDALLELARGPLRDGGLKVELGELRALVPPGQRALLSDPAGGAVPRLAQLARRLAARIDVIAELSRIARQDPVSGVRVSGVRVLCLRTLARDSPQPASALGPLLREAARDADAEVRLEAATALGDEGVAVLNALVADTAVDDDLAARAAAFLGPRLDAGIARATLQRERTTSSARRRPAVARACVAAGSDSSDLRRAGREAIAAIQSRLHGATPGQLSLDAGGAGQVALADDPSGRLSGTPAKDERQP